MLRGARHVIGLAAAASRAPPRRQEQSVTVPSLMQDRRAISASSVPSSAPPSAVDHPVAHHHRRSFQPFSDKEESSLVEIISTRPRHVLRHVRQLVWRSRKKELHFRNTATQLMVAIQQLLKKQMLDPAHASSIMEGILEECVKLSQHDIAHLLFRAFIRFRRYGCRITIDALRHLVDSYKGTDNADLMLQLAIELRDDPQLRPLCIGAYLFAGKLAEGEALLQSVPPADLGAEDIKAMLEGYDKLMMGDKVMAILEDVDRYGKTAEELADVFGCALKIYRRRDDEKSFQAVIKMARGRALPLAPEAYATVLRMLLRHAQSIEDVVKVEQDLREQGYTPDLTGNSVIISAYARMMHFGDKATEDVMLSKVDTLLTSVESRLGQPDADIDVSAAHLRAVIRGYGAAGRPELMKTAWERLHKNKSIANDTRVYNELLKWFSLMGNVKDVLKTKYEMAAEGVQSDAHSYTWVFRALGKWYPRQVEKFYLEMREARIRPDIALFTTLIGVYGDLENFARVDELLEEIRRREEMGTIQVSPSTYAVLLRVFAHDLDRVESVFKEAQSKAVAEHDHVMTSLLHALATHPQGEEKLQHILTTMPRWTVNVYNVLLNKYGKLNQTAKVEELLVKMRGEGVEFNDVTYGTLVTVFGRWKDTQKVHEVLEQLKTKEGTIAASFYSVLAATYSKIGDIHGIDAAWEDLISSRLFPDTETYNQFLSLYSKSNNVAKMQDVMDSMLKAVPPNPLTATTVVDMLGKAGRISEMESLVEDMRKRPETAPTIVTYHQMLNAYAKTGDIPRMERTHEELTAAGFEENAVTFNILMDGYGRARRFEQMMDVLQRRKDKGVAMEELGYCVLVSSFGRVRHMGEVQRLAEEVLSAAAAEEKAFDIARQRHSEEPTALPTAPTFFSTILTKKVAWTFIDALCRCNDVSGMEFWIRQLCVVVTAGQPSSKKGERSVPDSKANASPLEPNSDPAAVDPAAATVAQGAPLEASTGLLAALAALTTTERNNLIPYYCRAGAMEKVDQLVRLMESRQEDVGYAGLNAIAKGYARGGQFDRCVETLHHFRDRNLVPDASTALTLSGLFMKAGLHEQAQQIVQWRRQYSKAHMEDAEENIV